MGDEAHDDSAPLAGPVRAGHLGIENMAAVKVLAWGVMIDLELAFGPVRRLIGYDDLARACSEQDVRVGPGEMVRLHTSFASALPAAGGKPDLEVLAANGAVLDGSDEHLRHWVDTSGSVALIADNYALGAVPGSPSLCLPGVDGSPVTTV